MSGISDKTAWIIGGTTLLGIGIGQHLSTRCPMELNF